jgi:hypothetical protein
MSTTTSQALAAIRTQIGTANLTFPVYWQGEDVLLPDTPTTFAFVVFNNEGSGAGQPLTAAALETISIATARSWKRSCLRRRARGCRLQRTRLNWLRRHFAVFAAAAFPAMPRMPSLSGRAPASQCRG